MSSRILLLAFCAVILTCDGNIRVKRTRYSYPSRFYKKPPPPHVIKGPYSYTPPPNYMQDDDAPPFKYPKVSRKPSTDGLGDEDISNLMKYLSKKDLDKIVELASEKESYSDYPKEKYGPSFKRPERFTELSHDDEKFLLNSPFKDQEEKYKVEYNNKPRSPTLPTYPDPNANYLNDASQPRIVYSKPPNSYNNKYMNPSNSQMEMSKTQFIYNQQEKDISINIPFANPIFRNPVGMMNLTYENNQELSHQNLIHTNPPQYQNNTIHTPLNVELNHQYTAYVTPPPNMEGHIFTNSNTMKEEQLPKPLNLREDDYEASNTDQIEKVAIPDSYKVESFKELPLMHPYHNTKLHSSTSYNVPHYTVTQTKSQSASYSSQPNPPSKAPAIEKAPPGYTGKEMSDAHLKAVRIWTHHSSGTAYTLHDDGTLSLEKPRVKTSYGYA